MSEEIEAEMITFRVYGYPVAQGRPRFFRRGNFVGTYDPDKSKSWKTTVREQAIMNRADKILEGALRIELRFLLPRPKTLPKKIIHHTKKPDIDNLTKAIKDALRGVCYHDDSQIVELFATKEYENEQPGVMVNLKIIHETGGKS